MASILTELIDELNAKGKRIDKEILNIDRSSVIPDHFQKANSILDMTDEGIKVQERAKYLMGLKAVNDQDNIV
jgi:hypothetical protein